MTTRYRVTKHTDGPTGRITFTPEYYGWKLSTPFYGWHDFSYSSYNPVVCGRCTYYINFPSYEEAVAWIHDREEEITKSKIPDIDVVLPVDLEAKTQREPLTYDEMEALCVFDTPAERDAAQRYADYAWKRGWLLPTPICRQSAAWEKP